MKNRAYEKMAEAVARLQRMLEQELEPSGTTAAARVVVRLWPEVLERLDTGRSAELYAAENQVARYADQIEELEETVREHEAHGHAYRREIQSMRKTIEELRLFSSGPDLTYHPPVPVSAHPPGLRAQAEPVDVYRDDAILSGLVDVFDAHGLTFAKEAAGAKLRDQRAREAK